MQRSLEVSLGCMPSASPNLPLIKCGGRLIGAISRSWSFYCSLLEIFLPIPLVISYLKVKKLLDWKTTLNLIFWEGNGGAPNGLALPSR